MDTGPHSSVCLCDSTERNFNLHVQMAEDHRALEIRQLNTQLIRIRGSGITDPRSSSDNIVFIDY